MVTRTLAVALAALAALVAFPAAGGAATVPATERAGGGDTLVLARGGLRGGGLRGGGLRGGRYRGPRGYPRTYRPRRRSHFGRSIIRALGVAWLVHALFGWGGGGGSPFGLLIVVGLLAWIVARSRARRRMYAYR